MKIGILCFRSYDGYRGASELSLKEALEEKGHEGLLLQSYDFSFGPGGELFYHGEALPLLDGLISRARVIDQVENRLFIIELIEKTGIPMINSHEALLRSKNKWKTTVALLESGLPTVPTWVGEDLNVLASMAEKVGYPVVIKSVYGTYGLGVRKAENLNELKEVLKFFWKPDCIVPLLLQPFVAEAQGQDHRLFVVGDKVVAAMERHAPAGDFRAYSPKAEDAVPVEVSEKESRLAVEASRALGLDYAGVDIISTLKGPAILEVNGNPGLMRISAVTGVDVPAAIAQLAVERFGKGA
jgi:ribosomal protein S6--L-glutamate ligase